MVKEEVIPLLKECAQADSEESYDAAEAALFESSYWRDYPALRNYYNNHWRNCKEVLNVILE